jgi:hypothetical protein
LQCVWRYYLFEVAGDGRFCSERWYLKSWPEVFAFLEALFPCDFCVIAGVTFDEGFGTLGFCAIAVAAFGTVAEEVAFDFCDAVVVGSCGVDVGDFDVDAKSVGVGVGVGVADGVG